MAPEPLGQQGYGCLGGGLSCEGTSASLVAGSVLICTGTPAPCAGSCLNPSQTGSLSSHTEGPREGSGDFPSLLFTTNPPAPRLPLFQVIRPLGPRWQEPARPQAGQGSCRKHCHPDCVPTGQTSPWAPTSQGGSGRLGAVERGQDQGIMQPTRSDSGAKPGRGPSRSPDTTY